MAPTRRTRKPPGPNPARKTPAVAARRAQRILESGHVYFFYRPRIDKQEASGPNDIQRFYMVLHPRGRNRYRLLIIGEQRLPAVNGGGDRKSWAFVYKISDQADALEDELDPETYPTKTRGLRQLPPARPAGEGLYAVVRHGDHTHLAHALELPREPGQVQRALNILKEGSYVVSIRNPEAPPGPFVGLPDDRRARFPGHLQSRFRGRRFIPLDPPAFLNYEGAEILLIGARQNVEEELGNTLNQEHETETAAAIFKDLKLERDVHPLEPLFKGQWA